MKLAIESGEEHGIVVMHVKGRLVMGDETRQFRDEIRALLAAQKKRIVLDMSEIPYVDSSGIGALVEAVVLTATEGGRIRLASMQRMVHSALALHKLLPAFQVFPSVEEARAGFEASGDGAAAAVPQG